jgi:tetratricopeptide (TPR) repeat protein
VNGSSNVGLAILAAAAMILGAPLWAQATIQGTVHDAAGKPVQHASVRAEKKGAPAVDTETNAAGVFTFSIPPGAYRITAEKSGQHSRSTTISTSLQASPAPTDLVLETDAAAMQFADNPNFTVAGVTDWTAVGGHGSDSTLRTSEDLARETVALKPQASTAAGIPTEAESKLRAALAAAPGTFAPNHQLGAFYLQSGRAQDAAPLLQAAYLLEPSNTGNESDLAEAYKETGNYPLARDHVQKLLAHQESANLHRLLGELDEKMGEPLQAVHEDEQAVRLDPNEENYFAWGSELLLHRAVWQAAEVFKNGTLAHPKSARMFTALGTAQFAGDLYDEAAASLCAASDLAPSDPEPYSFMGRVAIASSTPLPCIESRLARFAQQQPGNATAYYLYAMAILKDQPETPQQALALLNKAVELDAKCGDAYLQLGILSQGDPQRAIGYYTRAIAANPQLGEAHYRLGVAYDRIGQAEKARQEFQLHDEIERVQAAAVERQRREVKQFQVVLQGQSGNPSTH